MTLVIMAAGLGSRFGGLKQVEPVDSYGHILVDYSVYDAKRAGFDRVVFIIGRDNCRTLKEIILKKAEKWNVKVDFAYQDILALPKGIFCPEGRIKPWGTAHAVASLSGVVTEPFAIINADDFYGAEAYRSMRNFLSHIRKGELCMIGYKLKNTLSENGSVSRGVCCVYEGYLSNITETTGIKARENNIVSDFGELSSDSTVSMNFWGMGPEIIEECQERFSVFLQKKSKKELDVCEFYLPKVISELIIEGKYRVRVIESEDVWQGITYREDKEKLMRFLDRMSEDGVYPADM